MSQTLLVLIGLPGSGKTQYAHLLMGTEPGKWSRINWDDLRFADPNYERGKFSRKAEEEMQKHSFELARTAASGGLNIIIDNTNLNPQTRERWKALAEELGFQYEERDVSISRVQTIRNDRGREKGKRVGQAVIDRMALWNGRINWSREEQIVLVDVDGTLANCEHRKSYLSVICPVCNGAGYGVATHSDIHGESFVCIPCSRCRGKAMIKDWNNFYSEDLVKADALIENVANLVNILDSTYTIAIVSGRPIDKCGIVTEDWLIENHVAFDYLFMRNSNDRRPDVVVKQEILNKLPKDRIAFVLDDRNSVVKMWRDNGLTCLQVAEGDF